MALELLCVEPIYPQYSGVLETCVALRYWLFEVLGSESVNVQTLQNDCSHIEDVHLLFFTPLINIFLFLTGVELRLFFPSKMLRGA